MSDLSDLYRDPAQPGSLGGVQKFLWGLRNTGHRTGRKKAETFLKQDELYQLHKPSRRRFPRRPTIVQGIDHLWQVDLSDVSAIKDHNDQHRYILFVIDAFSKYAWAVPLQDKKASTLAGVLRELIESTGRRPLHLMSDKGGEFVNRPVQSLLKSKDVNFYTSQNEETKAAIVERLQRTIKTKMFRYFTDKNTLRYVEVLPHLLSSYNRTLHSTTGMAPAAVDRNVDDEVRRRLAERWSKAQENKKQSDKIRVGDSVRISIARAPFRKGYLPQWTREIFTVAAKKTTRPATFQLKDYDGDLLEGTFYAQELQKVVLSRDPIYRVEDVLRRRTRRGRREVFVSWQGYPAKFNAWIPESSLVKL